MKSKVVPITLVAVVAITLMTTGIVYANDDNDDEMIKWIQDMLAWILVRITNLQEADVQHDEQNKKLTRQIEELQQENEKQQTQIKQLQDFRDDAIADVQIMHDDLDVIVNPVSTPPTPTPPPVQEPRPVTLIKSSVTRGDNLELIMNFEPIPQTIITDGIVNDTTQQVNATLNHVSIGTSDGAGMKYGAYFAYNASETERLYIQQHTFNDFKSINQTTYTFNIPIPYNHKTGSFDLRITIYDIKYVFKESGLKKDGSVWELDNFVTKPMSMYNLYYEVT